MNRNTGLLLLGAVMTIGGFALYFIFLEVETPFIGLRQAGLVVGILGILELVATIWNMSRRKDQLQ